MHLTFMAIVAVTYLFSKRPEYDTLWLTVIFVLFMRSVDLLVLVWYFLSFGLHFPIAPCFRTYLDPHDECVILQHSIFDLFLSPTIFHNTDGPGGHSDKRNEPGTRRQILPNLNLIYSTHLPINLPFYLSVIMSR